MSTIKATRVESEWSEASARALNDFIRDVIGVLNGGSRLQDQFRGVSRVVWNTDNAPARVRVSGRAAWVLCLGATDATGANVSGCPVTWKQINADVVVSAVGGLSSSTDYTMDLLVLEG